MNTPNTTAPSLTPLHLKRFWARVQKSEGCWHWLGHRVSKRQAYGCTIVDGKKHFAHRIALFIATGVWHNYLCVLHSCDNKKCVNPAHLRWGTVEENFKDALDRCPRFAMKDEVTPFKRGGANHSRAKLTDEDVAHIKSMLRERTIWQKDIAAKFGVDPATISNIKKGKAWGHVK